MDKEAVRQLLPEEPRKGLLQWAKVECHEDLGPDFLVWKSERVPIYDLEVVMSGKRPRYTRVATCTCLHCGAQMQTEYYGTTLNFWVDECGEWWALDPNGQYHLFEDEEETPTFEGYTVEVADGESLVCPMCYENIRTIQAKNLRGGRRKQILVVSIETVGEYAAVVYWLVRKEIFEDHQKHSVIPRDAYVLDERGTVHRYTHTTGGGSFSAEKNLDGWKPCTSKRDSLDTIYHDWGSINNRKKGGVFWPDVPDLTGTTAEKTGLQSYVNYEGAYSVHYLKVWKKYPEIENLVNTGWEQLIHHIIWNSFNGGLLERLMDSVMDIRKTKPHEILEMSKSDMKQIRRNGWQWGYEEQLLYQTFRRAGLGTALEFHSYLDTFTATGLRAAEQLQNLYGDVNLDKLARYLSRQNMDPREAGILLDTRRAAQALNPGRPLTQEELWPRNLQATHDRLTRARLLKIDADKAAKYQQGFDAVLGKYGDLQWSDGELCMILPRSYAELVQEGNVLRHCVGGYSDSHISGRDTIFFVRRYRRPERCYYTLDINMTDIPYRNQLHGYGNERHGVNKEHRHKIPQKVLDFCDRWEREILQPWYRDQQNKQKEGQTA